jgi:hypothetical protein
MEWWDLSMRLIKSFATDDRLEISFYNTHQTPLPPPAGGVLPSKGDLILISKNSVAPVYV